MMSVYKLIACNANSANPCVYAKETQFRLQCCRPLSLLPAHGTVSKADKNQVILGRVV